MLYLLIWLSSFILTINVGINGSETSITHSSSSAFRYILYDVNPYEGFNLRRDVYIRLAVLFHKLQGSSNKWRLVLPPWNNLLHWRSVDAGNQYNLPWGIFFNLRSLQSFAPVIEMFEFLEDHQSLSMDNVIVLQHYEDIWNKNFSWTDKWDIEECKRPLNFMKDINGIYKGSLLGFRNITARNVTCISFQGTASMLKNIFDVFRGRFIVFEHAEIILHDYYGGPDYWKCRKSMKFSDELIKLATNFRKSSLPSATGDNMTMSRYFKGDPYVSVHLRRRDYVLSHPLQVPNISWAAEQIKSKLVHYNLTVVFVASDAYDAEIEELATQLLPFKTIRYVPPLRVLQKFKDGGIAIIEQIICSYAGYFIGTYESTFSFRIQEERELLGFDPDTTFNRLCGSGELNCKQPTRWRVVELDR